jgi:hypothetical protein
MDFQIEFVVLNPGRFLTEVKKNSSNKANITTCPMLSIFYKLKYRYLGKQWMRT